MKNLLPKWIVTLLLGMQPVTSFLFSAEAPQEIQRPAAIIFPWKKLLIVPEIVSAAHQEMQAAYQTWGNALLQNPRPLASVFPSEPPKALPINLRHAAEAMLVGDLRAQSQPLPPLIVEPALCSLADSYLIFVTLSHRDNEQILALGHHLLPRNRWVSDKKAKKLTGAIAEALGHAQERALAHLQGVSASATALHVGLSLGQQITRKDQGSSFCLSLLAMEKLAAEGYMVTSLVANEELAMLERMFPSPAKKTRATRRVILEWLQEPGHPQNRKLPVSYALRTLRAESVFANEIAEPQTGLSHWTFTPQADGSLAYDMNADFTAFLAQEGRALDLKVRPRISRIDRAWVYLDRGRAWGLKIDDRLLVKGQDIKGHVVGFFGPELGLKSPLGFPVHEGAIVYVRLGQNKAKVGQELDFDAQTYPTSWPPKAR